MIFTEETNYLLRLYNESRLNVEQGDILEIPAFQHDNCNITVSFIPSREESIAGIMAVKIRTLRNVVFTPFYLKYIVEDDNNNDEIEFNPFFDRAEYRAIRDEIIRVDGNETRPLFEDISRHIFECSGNKLSTRASTAW